MPRYFFNHRTKDGQREVDIDGLKLPSLNTALEEATFAAQGAVALADAPIEGAFEIEDEGRVVVARVPYAVRESEVEPETSPSASPFFIGTGPYLPSVLGQVPCKSVPRPTISKPCAPKKSRWPCVRLAVPCA
jgi:hypothetical protein